MNKNNPKKVFVGISGGVDSAASATLLQQQGFEVTGIYMRIWKEKGSPLEAKGEEENARRVAKELEIGFVTVDLRKEFKKEIVDYFLSQYESGRTPNPCVRCNREIKFGLLFKKSMEMGADFFATGHYVRIRQNISQGKNGRKIKKYKLSKAKDIQKDQSYFLYNLNQKILSKTIFPLGSLTKPEVREIAKENSLFVHDKSDSQEVCFITDKYYGEFLKRMKVKMKAGDIVDEEGNVLGEHRGLPLYTIGQRRDIRIGGTGPYFVVGLDYRNNHLVVSRDGNSKKLFVKKFTLRDVNWVGKQPETYPLKVKIKTRYRMEAVDSQVSKEKNKIIVTLSKKSRAVMPGQSAVFYLRSDVLGGGVIDRILE
ncbi:MAG: tRNA 2-thiouridine(34) synthase MnmA [Candidatus Pacebacteria bacterium]|nr:tRNA 2-thiouridine(34) synthase MnmA [Candidatus Paceibacterota bacterium]